MKSKDQILLESAVNKVLLKEDIMNNSTFDDPAMQPKQNERADYAPEPTFDWTGSDKEDEKDGSFYDQTRETIVSNIIEIEKQIREEASQGTLNTREVDQFLKELHNILNLEIDKVKTKLKDIAVKSNRG
jgi:hypothetical protein